MKWDIRKSNIIKKEIAENIDLMRKLSSITEEVLKKNGIELEGLSYVFEPRIFQLDSSEIIEVGMKSRVAMITAILQDFVESGSGVRLDSAFGGFVNLRCLPACGPLDPISLKILERIRIAEITEIRENPVRISLSGTPDPIPPAYYLMNQIMGRRDLLSDFSNSVFEILEEFGIKFGENEGCVFTPILFETPFFAQKVAVSKQLPEVSGFGPQIYASPTLQHTSAIQIRPFPGIIEYNKFSTVGVILDHWWWIGIPAPEILRALDVMREIE